LREDEDRGYDYKAETEDGYARTDYGVSGAPLPRNSNGQPVSLLRQAGFLHKKPRNLWGDGAEYTTEGDKGRRVLEAVPGYQRIGTRRLLWLQLLTRTLRVTGIASCLTGCGSGSRVLGLNRAVWKCRG
jgi:hypothetical protein